MTEPIQTINANEQLGLAKQQEKKAQQPVAFDNVQEYVNIQKDLVVLSAFTFLASKKQEDDQNAVQKGNPQAPAPKGKAPAPKAPPSPGDSLPNQFQWTILHWYMPNQEKYLRMLAEALEFANGGAEIFNEILNTISDFASANINYGLNNWLAGQSSGKDGVYNGSADNANNKIGKERDQANADKNRAEQELKYVEEQLKKLEEELKDGKITQSQYNQLAGQLKTLKANLVQAVTYLTKLANFLKYLKAVPDGDGKYKIEYTGTGPNALPKGKTWQDVLSDDENNVINGSSTSNPPGLGGLLHINEIVSSDQTKWGSQSQQQQMQLQLVMTEIQQEWTIVSTSEQLLNQMYLTVAQGISK